MFKRTVLLLILSNIVISDMAANRKIAADVQMVKTCIMIKGINTMILCLYKYFRKLNLLVNRTISKRFILASLCMTVLGTGRKKELYLCTRVCT